MAYCGSWGVFIPIPRCGSTYTIDQLIKKMGRGVHVGPHHGLPDRYDNTQWWTIVRPPHEWYRSLWAYMQKNGWQAANSESPIWNMVTSRVARHPTPDFNLFIEKIHNEWYGDRYGLCTWVFTSLMPPGIGWYKLDFVDQFFKIEFGFDDVDTTPVNASEDLPEINEYSREAIENMDRRVYIDFHFRMYS